MNANHIYRVVWSEVHATWIAVSEITRTRAKRKTSRLALSLALASAGALAGGTPATVVPTGGNTAAYISANGVPVVNINTTNAAGLSHNQYTRYDVESKGLVLNNGNFTQIHRASQLAGSVLANPNLNQQARVILNEVVSTNRSSLAGFTEVVGGRADVVVANPNGITCSGCGFINTDRATLTTGTPQIGASGSLAGFRVERGDLLIQGNGLNASGQQMLDLVARSIRVDAPVNVGGSLQLVAGPNTWSYDTRSVTGTTGGNGPVPSYAIDSSALGGMYAGRIRLIATEAGVGVRMLGEAAASADDFNLTSAGRVVIHAQISAAHDLALSSTASGSDAVAVTDSTLTSGHNLSLSATGGLTLSGGVLKAASDIGYQSGTLIDRATSSGLIDNNKRHSGGNFSIVTSGPATLDGVSLDSASHLDAAFGGSAMATGGAILHGNSISLSTAGNLELGDATVRSTNDLTLAASGNVNIAHASHQEVRTANGTLAVTAGGDLANAGDLLADGGEARFVVGGSIANQGLLRAGTNLTATAGTISNDQSGAVVALDNLSVNTTSGDLVNSGTLYGGSLVTAASPGGTLRNTRTGEILSGAGMRLTADLVVNNNTVQALNDILITTITGFRNEIEGGMPAKTSSEAVTAENLTFSTLKEGRTCWFCSYIRVREDTVTVTEHWADGTPDLSTVPQPVIAAGHDLTINLNAGTGKNTGGVLSAGNDLAIGGSGPATFDNTAIVRYERQYKRRWAEHEDDAIDHPVRFFYNYADSSVHFDQMPTWNSFDGFVFSWETLWDPGYEHMYGHVRYSGSRSAALENEARQKAYRYLTSTAVAENLRSARLHGNSVTFKGVALANDGPAVAPAPYDPGTAPTPTPLPASPNGFFVPASESSARYLIETNPRYGLGSAYAGSDYLLKRLGIDPDAMEKRLGDANYEAYLIRQQLIGQTGSAVLNGYASEAKQMERLMDQAAGESKSLGLTIGKALTADQVGRLSQDIVWMVETTVGGQKVLQPVVYLAAESRKSIVSGAVITGQEINLNVTSLGNTGGTISGAKSVNVSAQGDITNTSGTIKGGEVSLKSAEGSIVNSRAEGLGAESAYKAAGIEATGNLTVDAAKNISIRAAEVKAGGSAALTAGGSITADTLVDTRSTGSTTAGSANVITQTGPTSTFTLTERNVGSVISTGGNLTLTSGGDTTLAGTRANVGGDLKVDSGGNFSILSRQDKTTTHSESMTSGLGVGGGLWGTEKTTVDDFTGQNFGSAITVGGKADIDAAGDMTLRGSSLDIGKSATIDTGSVTIEQGLDERHTVTRTDTTSFLSTGSKKGSDASAGASAGSGHAAASANASASASASENSEFNLMEQRTTTVEHTKTTGVASRLTTGDDLSITTDGRVTVQGSNVEAGKALSIDAGRIDVLAGENREKTTTTVESTKIGIYTDSKAEAKAEAGASATGMSASAKAGASAEASADSTVTIGARVESSTDETTSLKHTSSSLKSGTAMTLKASEEARFVGAKVQSGGDLNIEAKDITNLAAEDRVTTTSDKTTRTAGIYLEDSASAEAHGSVNAGPGNVSALGGVSAGAEAGAGLHYNQTTENNEQGATHNVVNTFESGGSISRTAAGTITDQGTQLDARQDITQSATTLKEVAADDKNWSSRSKETHDAKIGVYASGSFSGDAGAQTSVISTGKYAEDLGPEASAGIKAKYSYDKSSESTSETTAVTSRYKAGGSISSTTTDKTTLIGTQFEAGKDVAISAGSLDYQAAKDTYSTSSETRSINAEAKAKLTGTVGAEASGSYDQSKASSSASTARAGGISAGGNVTVTTRDDARFEGTAVAADGKAKIESTAGNVTFDAAKSTAHEESSGFNVSAGFGSTNQPGKETGKKAGNEHETKTTLGGGYSTGKSDSTTETGASVNARNVEISAGRDTTLHGTQIEATESASIKAQGDVKLLEATNSSSGSSFGISGKATSMNLTKPDGENKKAQYGSGNVNVGNEERKTGTATAIKAGGDITVKGTNIISQQAGHSAGGKLVTEGTKKTQDLTNVNKGMKVDANMSFVHKSGSKAKGKDDKPGADAPSETKDKKSVSKTKKPLRRNTRPMAGEGGQASIKPSKD